MDAFVSPRSCSTDYALSNSEAMVDMELSLDNYGHEQLRLEQSMLFRERAFERVKTKVVTVVAVALMTFCRALE